MVSGKFKTAFPGGKPKGPAESGETGGPQEDPAAPKAQSEPEKPADAAEKKDETPKDDGTVKESVNNEGMVVLFSDADMLYDAFCVQQDPMTGGLIATNSNLPLMLNAIEVLSGGGDLLKVRSRASTQRPFTKMDELRENVERGYRPKLKGLETELNEIAQQIGPLRVKDGALIIDPAQVKKMEELERKQTDNKKEIREIKKTQNKQIAFTESIITLLNVLAVPLLVIAVGLLLAIRRRIATAAV